MPKTPEYTERFNGEKLKELRLKRDWTLRDLADKLQVAPSAVMRWENCTRKPHLKMISRIAKLFVINPKKLLVEVQTAEGEEISA